MFISNAAKKSTLFSLAKKLKSVNQSETDLSSKTKAQIVELGTSIDVTLSMSLSKNVMISTLKATDEWKSYEAKRKALDPLL